MGDYDKWTLSALKATCRRLYKENQKELQAIESNEGGTSELAKMVLAKLGVQDVKYHNWTKENLKAEGERLGLPVTGGKAALIEALTDYHTSHKNNDDKSDESDKSEKSDDEKNEKTSDDDNDEDTNENKKGKKRGVAEDDGDEEEEKERTKTTSKRRKADKTTDKEASEEKTNKTKKTQQEKLRDEHDASSPSKSIIKPSSPAKRTRAKVAESEKESKSGSKLKFVGVEVREYSRRHGGGGGVPHSGAYPLGLDWSYDRDHVLQRGLTDYEEMRENERHTKGSIPAVSEKKRQELLETADDRAFVERTSSFTRQKSELDKLRKVRKDIGCDCDGEECGTKKCACNKSGVECLEDYCSCSNCENPQNL